MSQEKRYGGAGRIDMMVKQAGKDVLVVNRLPAHWGGEITDEIIDGPHSIRGIKRKTGFMSRRQSWTGYSSKKPREV